MFQDYLFFGSDVESRYVYRMAHLSALVQHAQQLHKLSNERACALGEGFLACVLLSSILEDEERFNLRIRHSNEFLISAETNQFAHVKGFFECDEGSPTVKAIDAGQRPLTELHVRSLRAIPDKTKVTEGNTLIETDSFVDAANDHIVRSFQMASEMRFECWVDPRDQKIRAFGVIYMELPDIEVSVAQELWNHVDSLPPLAELLSKSDDPDRLASLLIPHKTAPVRSVNPKWQCTCSQEAVESMILKLPNSELMDMLQKGAPVDVSCHFCKQAYSVSVDRVRQLALSSMTNPNPGTKN